MRFHLRLIPILVSVAGLSILGAGAAATAHSAPPPWCLSAADSTAVQLQRSLRDLVTTASGDSLRVSLELPLTTAEQIMFVTDDSVCHRLSLTHDSIYAGDSTVPKQQALYAVRYDGYYAAYWPGFKVGEWGAVFFFDTATFERRAGAMGWR